MVTRVITDAIVAGLAARSATVKEETKAEVVAQPLADVEKDLLAAATPDAPVEA